MTTTQTNQFFMYSIDTSALFTDDESAIQKKHMEVCSKLKKDDITENRNKRLKYLKRGYSKKLEQLIKQFSGIRQLRHDVLVDKNIIASFESNFSRLMGIKTGSLSLDVLTIRIYHYDMLDQINNGFQFGEEFVFYTSSAGQIRTKTVMFARKKKFEQFEMALRVGLTDEKINSYKDKEGKRNGYNSNKLMSYMALNNSSSVEWDIDLNRAIVCEDMEFDVIGDVDFIHNDSYKIEPIDKMKVPVNHTDGAGMYLPSDDEYEAFQCRGGWLKGLMIPFRFDLFVKDKEINPNTKRKVKDIWNKEWDLIDDQIKYVFTKSQLKMWKFYSSWEQYKKLHKQYGCKFAKCQFEPARKNQRLGYQYLQTLTDISDDELKYLASKTLRTIEGIGRDKDISMDVLGCDEDGGKNAIQKAISLYPEMLNDPYSKQLMREAKNGLIKQALHGKLSIESQYAFVSPDWFAYCQKIILHIDKPRGLLSDGKVSCRWFKDKQEIDCLRSPHLSREHAVKTNVRNKTLNKWFISNCIYTSTQDLISKTLQFDVDGDSLLLVSDKRFIEIAKRNMKGIRPLYYKMEKAKDKPVNAENRLEGLKDAFKINIGLTANEVSKVWASDNPNLDVVRWLVMESNALIDYAKTKWKPTRPPHVDKLIKEAIGKKLPHFFRFAKDKSKSEVEDRGKGVVDRLYELFVNENEDKKKHENISKVVGKMDYRKMMNNKDVGIREDIVSVYVEFSKKQYKNRNDIKGNKKNSNIKHLVKIMKSKLAEIETDENIVVDVLIEYLYNFRKSSKKRLLWDAYGNVAVANLDSNIKNKLDCGYKLCKCCGKRKRLKGKQITCSDCKKIQAKERKIKWNAVV